MAGGRVPVGGSLGGVRGEVSDPLFGESGGEESSEGCPSTYLEEKCAECTFPPDMSGTPLAGPLVARFSKEWVRNLASHPPEGPLDRDPTPRHVPGVTKATEGRTGGFAHTRSDQGVAGAGRAEGTRGGGGGLKGVGPQLD
jgi:hypothetical protein